MSARSLTPRQIGDVAKQPADRRAQNMQDVERLLASFSHRHLRIINAASAPAWTVRKPRVHIAARGG
jgi:hypothetical protein